MGDLYMGDICKTLAKIYGVIGAIGTIVASITLGKTASIRNYSISYERSWLLTIAIFLGVGLSVAMVTAALYTLGEIYDRVYSSSFSANSSISAETATSLTALAKENEEKKMLASGGWKCPAPCNKIHPSYETSCSCGKSKWDV